MLHIIASSCWNGLELSRLRRVLKFVNPMKRIQWAVFWKMSSEVSGSGQHPPNEALKKIPGLGTFAQLQPFTSGSISAEDKYFAAMEHSS